MSGSGLVAEAFAHHVEQHPDVTLWCVAYSGGMDSHVLLRAAVERLGADERMRLRAVHVDHQLHEDSALWARHAATVAESLGVPLVTRRVRVENRGQGPEAAAREARYAAFADVLEAGEHLLLGQHARDQAETFLLQALRGSGPDGLASIPRKRVFGRGIIARPLLGCPHEAIVAAAKAADLNWIEDPSNLDPSFDRNYLRQEILPRLERRWPAATRTLGRAALRAAAASRTLLALARDDLDRVRVRGSDEECPAELGVTSLRTLPRERVYNVLRLWVRQAGLRMPRLQDLDQVLETLVRARDGSGGLVSVRDYELRRYRDRLYLLPPQTETPAFAREWPAPFEDLVVPEAGIVLTRAACERQGIALPADTTVSVRSRAGGETIRLGEPAFHKSVKKLLQESGVPPWRREAIPLLYVGGRLAAVWNLAVAAEFRTPARAAGDDASA